MSQVIQVGQEQIHLNSFKKQGWKLRSEHRGVPEIPALAVTRHRKIYNSAFAFTVI